MPVAYFLAKWRVRRVPKALALGRRTQAVAKQQKSLTTPAGISHYSSIKAFRISLGVLPLICLNLREK